MPSSYAEGGNFPLSEVEDHENSVGGPGTLRSRHRDRGVLPANICSPVRLRGRRRGDPRPRGPVGRHRPTCASIHTSTSSPWMASGGGLAPPFPNRSAHLTACKARFTFAVWRRSDPRPWAAPTFSGSKGFRNPSAGTRRSTTSRLASRPERSWASSALTPPASRRPSGSSAASCGRVQERSALTVSMTITSGRLECDSC